MIEWAYDPKHRSQQFNRIAALSRAVFKAAKAGDESANQILEEAAHRLAVMTIAATRKLHAAENNLNDQVVDLGAIATAAAARNEPCLRCHGCDCTRFGLLTPAEQQKLRTECKYDIVFTGGNLVAVDSVLRQSLLAHLARELPLCKVHIPDLEAAHGAALIAINLYKSKSNQ